MSIKLMTAAWASSYATGPKMVLLALCDNANDEGVCWPSIPTISAKCSMSERSVFSHLAALGEDGAVTRVERPGKASVYRIDPCKFCTPADSAPLQILQDTPANSAVAYIDEPSRNRKGTTTPRKPTAGAKQPEGVDDSVWCDWLTLRKAKKAPVTETVLSNLRSQAEKAGLTLQQAMEMCCQRGWTGFNASWVAEPQRGSFGAPVAVTVPSRAGRDPVLVKLDEDGKLAGPPPAEVRARMKELLGRVRVAA